MSEFVTTKNNVADMAQTLRDKAERFIRSPTMIEKSRLEEAIRLYHDDFVDYHAKTKRKS